MLEETASINAALRYLIIASTLRNIIFSGGRGGGNLISVWRIHEQSYSHKLLELIFFEQPATTVLNFNQIMGWKPPLLITNQSQFFFLAYESFRSFFFAYFAKFKEQHFHLEKNLADMVEDELKNEFTLICRLKIWSSSRLFDYISGILHSRCSLHSRNLLHVKINFY